MSLAIKIENLSKQYRLGLVSTRTLSHDLNRWWQTSILGKPDPYLKIGETNVRESKGNSEYVWALKDINLEIEEGEILGIIGKNGAGKSTLLKILSKVTSPTTGIIKARGRIASLLEVGTGFHQEMTGRENIYMNGAIMGMTKKEITSKLDAIVDFAGVERYLDTPVKRYSSGMTVRLGFSIAAHLEPEILVVDEVLAVGDAEFQKKAVGKMQEVSQKQGRTVLFVSHNMTSIKNLCSRGIILNNGYVHKNGPIEYVLSNYLSMNFQEFNSDLEQRKRTEGNQDAYFSKIVMTVNGNRSERLIPTGASVSFYISIKSVKPINKLVIFLSVYNNEGSQLIHSNNLISNINGIHLVKGLNEVKCTFNYFPLQIGSYFLNLAMDGDGIRLDRVEQALQIEIVGSDVYKTGKLPKQNQGLIILPNRWEACI